MLRFTLILLVAAAATLLPNALLAQAPDPGVERSYVFIDDYLSGNGLWFTNASNTHRLNLQAYVQSQYEYRSTESLDDFSRRFRIRRARMTFQGQATKLNLSYRLRVDFVGSSDELNNGILQDAWVSWRPHTTTRLFFGQRRVNSDNRELTIASDRQQFVERSRLTSSFAAIRDFGIFYEGRFRLGDKARFKPSASVVTGDGQNAFLRNYGGFKYEARADFFPFGYFIKGGQFIGMDLARERKPKLMLGAYYSLNQGMSSRRGRGSGDIVYLDTDFVEALPDFTKFGVDLFFKYKGITALAEWVSTSATVPVDDIFYRVRNDGSISSNFDGGVENYVKGRMMLGSGYNVQVGYLTRNNYSVDVRYTKLNPDDNSFLNNAQFYARNSYFELGGSKLFSRSDAVKVQFSLILTDLEDAALDLEGVVIEDDYELTGRLMVQFSL